MRTGMSSLSHHASRMTTPANATKVKPSARQMSHFLFERPAAAATKNANTASSGTSHRQGNCTNRSSGKRRQKILLGGNMKNTEAAPSVSNIHQSSGKSRRVRAAKTAAIPVSKITASATADTFQLNSTN